MSDLKTNLQEILQEKQDKIIPENIKKDVQIFDVTGTYEGSGSSGGGDVKLFETVEEMQADSSAQEGDLAVVYRNEVQNMSADTQTQYITFPETVTLPEAFTGSSSIRLRAVDESVMFDGDIRLSKTSFRFDGYSESGMIRVQYSSSDGITYTRTRFSGDSGDLTNPVDLGTSVGVYMSEEWNDNLGYFMQIGGMTFDGLYEYKTLTKLDNCITLTDVLDNVLYVLPVTNPEEYADKKDFLHILYLIKSVKLRGTVKNVSVYEPMDYCILYNANATSGNTGDNVHTLLQDNNGCYIGGDEYKELNSTHNNEIGLVIEKYVNSALSDKSIFTKKELFDKRIKIGTDNTNWSYCKYEFDILQDYDLTAVGSYNLYRTYNSDAFEFGTGNTATTSKCVYEGVFNADITPTLNYIETATEIVNYTSYVMAENQYNLVSANQLLPKISAYGKNGNVMGDGTIWNEIPEQVFYKNILGYDVPSNQYGNIRRSTSLPNNKVLYGNFDKSAENYIRILRFDDGTYPIKTHTDFGAYAYQRYDANYYMSQYVAVSDKYTYSIGINRQESQAWIYRYDVVNKTIEEKIVPEDMKDAIMTHYSSIYDVYQDDMYIAIHKSEILTLYKYNFDSNVFTSVYTEALQDEYSKFLTIQCTPNGKVAIACTNNTGKRINYISYDIASNTSKKVLDNFTQSNSAGTVRISYVMDKKHLVIACDPGGFILNTDEETYDRVNIVSDAIPAATMCINNRLFPLDLDTSRNLTYYDLTTKEFTKTDVVISASYYTLQFVGYTDEGIVYDSSAGVMWVTDTSMEIYSKDVDPTHQNYQTSESDSYYGMNYNSNCYAIEKFDNYMRFDTCGIDGYYHDYFGFANWYAGNINIVDPTTDADVIFGSNFEISSDLPEKANISMKEYNTALDTSEQILGEGETVNE